MSLSSYYFLDFIRLIFISNPFCVSISKFFLIEVFLFTVQLISGRFLTQKKKLLPILFRKKESYLKMLSDEGIGGFNSQLY